MQRVTIKNIELYPNTFLVVNHASKRIGVVGDIHIGFDKAIARDVSVPLNYREMVERSILHSVETFELDGLIINGDIQHEFSPQNELASMDVMRFIRFLEHLDIETKIILGNHDTFVGKVLNRREHWKGKVLESLDLGGIRIFHGDKRVKYYNKTISGHEHPTIYIKDEVGGGMRMRTFLVYHDRETLHIIMPSFIPYSHGTNILQVGKGDCFNVVLNDVGVDNFEVYAISPFEDEILYFGRVKEIRKIM